MRLRLIVMNGQRIVESEEDGEWKIQEVSKAGKLKPGIYNLYSSQQTDKSKRHVGVIVQCCRQLHLPAGRRNNRYAFAL